DENEPELTYPCEDVDPLNTRPPASESEPENENTIEYEDETVPASIHEVGESSAVAIPQTDSDNLLPGFMRWDIDSLLLILDLGSEVRSSVEQGTTTMEKLVEKLGNAEDKVKCKKLNNKLEEARFSNTFLRMQNERVERDLYWTRVQAYELYQEMIHRGFVFEERPNEAIDVPVKDEENATKESRGKSSDVNAAITVERARQANVRSDSSGSGPIRGQDPAPVVREYTFAGFIKCNPTAFHGTEGAIELRRWFEKTKSVFRISECAKGKKVRVLSHRRSSKNEERAVKLEERVKVDAYIRGLTDNIKGEVTSSKPANLNEANNQKQGNARAMITASTDGNVSSGLLPSCEHCFTRHAGLCTIKCHKCGKIGHKARYCKGKNVATCANALPILTCYVCGEQGHTRNRCSKKVKKEEVEEVRGQAYAIKDAEPKGPNVVTGTFLLNGRYAFILFDLGSDRSFVDTRFSSMLNINPVKIGASYEVELNDERVVSTNTVLKSCTLN
nr:hypothetical protein [Tanacetum cinerariifolium]